MTKHNKSIDDPSPHIYHMNQGPYRLYEPNCEIITENVMKPKNKKILRFQLNVHQIFEGFLNTIHLDGIYQVTQ